MKLKIHLSVILSFLALALLSPALAFAQSQGVDVPEAVGGIWGKLASIIGIVNGIGLSVMKWAPSGWRTYINAVMTALSGVGSAIAGSAIGASDLQIGLAVLTALISGLGPMLMGIRAAKMLNPTEAAAVMKRAR